MRYLVKRIPSTSLVQYDGSRYYCEIAGGTAEKSTVDTTGLLAGSKYLDVQTGTWYVYDELTNAWAVSAEGGSADPAVVEAAVEAWLDAHPEATTTVQDGSITYAKLDTNLKGKADAVTQLSDEIDASLIINTASGAVASFADGSALPARSAVVTLEPVQDLHGYDHPWPGGGSKNLLDIMHYDANSYRISSIVDNGDGSFTINASGINAYAQYLINVVPNSQYCIKAAACTNVSGNASQIGLTTVYDGTENTATKLIDNGHIGTVKAFTPTASTVLVVIKVTGGLGDGVGLIVKPQIELGSTATEYVPYANICPISGHTGTDIKRSGADTSVYDQLTVTFPSAAGTMYGGTYDFVSGKLIVDRASVDLGTLTWTKATTWGSHEQVTFFRPSIPIATVSPSDVPKMVCSAYRVLSSNNVYLGNDMSICQNSGVRILDSSYADLTAAEFKSVMSGVQLVYELATPVEYDLTPQELNTLLGQNNVWSTNGTNTAIEYKADTKLYIDGKIAELSALIASL